MRRLHPALLPLLLAPVAVMASDAGLARCRAIANDTARLACYDALVPAPPDAATLNRQFGLPAASPVERVQAIESHIPGRFSGWSSRSRIRLANGQVWEISDGSSGAYHLLDPKVRIRRGALGTFFLEIEGENQSPRVRRVE